MVNVSFSSLPREQPLQLWLQIWISRWCLGLGLLGGALPQQKPMAGCETSLLLNLHRAVKFHYKLGQHGDYYLGQDIFNSILMVLSCHSAHRDILHTAEDSGTGQMKICPSSYSKWALTAHHMPDAVWGGSMQWWLRHCPCPAGVHPSVKEMSVSEKYHDRVKRLMQRKEWGFQVVRAVGAQWDFWERACGLCTVLEDLNM